MDPAKKYFGVPALASRELCRSNGFFAPFANQAISEPVTSQLKVALENDLFFLQLRLSKKHYCKRISSGNFYALRGALQKIYSGSHCAAGQSKGRSQVKRCYNGAMAKETCVHQVSENVFLEGVDFARSKKVVHKIRN